MPATAKKPRAWEQPKTAAALNRVCETVATITKSNSNYASIIDEYARIDAQIKELEKSKKVLGDEIRALGEGEHNGTRCKAVVQFIPTTRLDTEILRETLPAELLEKYSKTSTTIKVSIKALI